jgi:hypothetical protein
MNTTFGFFVFRAVPTWESDVFAFLDARLAPKQLQQILLGIDVMLGR